MMWFAAILVLLLPGVQPGAGGEAPHQPEPRRVRYEELPAGAQLGLRVEAIKSAWPTLPVVVIVRDTGSYLEAIANWTPHLRFPVLINDGTPASREDIARFVRAFRPGRVVRWSGGEPVPAGEALRERVDRAVYRVWEHAAPGEDKASTVRTDAELVARWRALGVPRSGIVIAAHDDPAWTAAIALSAGHAQPLAWVDRPPNFADGILSEKHIRKLETEIEGACEKSGLMWRALGDHIDTVAVCIGIPCRVHVDGTNLAVTDVLGRHLGEKADTGERWAWTAQVLGNESRAAYAAMCSLFLGTERAWLFDGYPLDKPWSNYDATGAGEYLERAGIRVTVDDSPRSGERAWRVRASRAVDAGLIAVNTKGMANEFQLEPGRCLPADVPVLNVPAIVYMVHSWSALAPIDRSTLGARWLERGAYAYLGSVDEPYLHAFIPTPIAMGRFGSKYVFAAAVRADERAGQAKAWKLTVLGDPLVTLGPGVRRVESNLPLEGAIDLQVDLREALHKKDFGRAIRALVMQGRDEGVADLVRGVLREEPEALTPEGAEDAILPLFRQDDGATLAAAYIRLTATASQRGDLRDALWHSMYLTLADTRDQELVSMMRVNIRDDARERDARELAAPFARIFGPDAASRMQAEPTVGPNGKIEPPRIDNKIRPK